MLYDFPTDDLYVVHGTMGAVAQAIDAGGAGRTVLMRFGATRVRTAEELDIAFVLNLDMAVGVVAGLMSTGQEAFGVAPFTAAMHDRLRGI